MKINWCSRRGVTKRFNEYGHILHKRAVLEKNKKVKVVLKQQSIKGKCVGENRMDWYKKVTFIKFC